MPRRASTCSSATTTTGSARRRWNGCTTSRARVAPTSCSPRWPASAAPSRTTSSPRPYRACSLDDSVIMDSLTPHKLFRRAFLDEHRIRFPEGKRRLEDHLFVSTAYLLATTISIYADYTCYFHIRREDSSNAGFRRIDWPEYFDNLAESLDGVVARTEPGPRPGSDLAAMAAGRDGATAERRAPGANGRRRGRRPAGRRAAGCAAVLQRGRGRAPAADRLGRSVARSSRATAKPFVGEPPRSRAGPFGPDCSRWTGPPTGCRSPAPWPSPTATMGWPSSGLPSCSEATVEGVDLWDPDFELVAARSGRAADRGALVRARDDSSGGRAGLLHRRSRPEHDGRRTPAAERPVGPERPSASCSGCMIGAG